MTDLPKTRLCLMLGDGVEEAASFYAETFPDSRVEAVQYAPGDAAKVLIGEFTVLGLRCIGVNDGGHFKHSEAFSFQIATEDQAETDHDWNAIVENGGAESMCGWCRDRWGVSWQITPRTLTEAMAAGGAEAKRAYDAMLKMKKIDVAEIDRARAG